MEPPYVGCYETKVVWLTVGYAAEAAISDNFPSVS
jgi:hypothetical protein